MEVVKPVLEMGIDGIIPMVVWEAEEAIKRSTRPSALWLRPAGPSPTMHTTRDYLAHSAESFLRIIQIEHIKAVEAIDEILALEALDAVIIGPNDLSASIGLLGESLHPAVLVAGKRVIEAGKRAGKPVGVSIGPSEAAIRAWQQLGVDFMSVGDDISFLHQGAMRTFAMVGRKLV